MPSESSSASEFRRLRLPDEIRSHFSTPLGPVLTTEEAKVRLKGKVKVATCGDVVTKNALDWGLTPFLAIVDGKTERNTPVAIRTYERLIERGKAVMLRNPPGTISIELQDALHSLATAQGGIIIIDGEEDLAVLPLLLEMPLGSIVIYGQPGKGLCMVDVDVRHREIATHLLGMLEAY